LVTGFAATKAKKRAKRRLTGFMVGRRKWVVGGLLVDCF
jgi:hypothetical protein